MVSSPVKLDNYELHREITQREYHEYVKEKLSFLSCPTWKSNRPDEVKLSAVYAKIKHETDIVDKRFEEETAGDILAGIRFDIDKQSFQKYQEETSVGALYPALIDYSYSDDKLYWSATQASQDEQRTYWNDIKAVGFGRRDRVSACHYNNPFDPFLTFSGLLCANECAPEIDISSSASTENLFLAAENSVWILEDYLQKYREYLMSLDNGSVILDEAIENDCKLEKLLTASPIPSPVCEINGDKELEILINKIQSDEIKSIWERPVANSESPRRSNNFARHSDSVDIKPGLEVCYRNEDTCVRKETKLACPQPGFEEETRHEGFAIKESQLVPELKSNNGRCLRSDVNTQPCFIQGQENKFYTDYTPTSYCGNNKDQAASQKDEKQLTDKGRNFQPNGIHNQSAVASVAPKTRNPDTVTGTDKLAECFVLSSPGIRLRPAPDTFYTLPDSPSTGTQIATHHQASCGVERDDKPPIYHPSQQTTTSTQAQGINIPAETYHIQPRYMPSGYELRVKPPTFQEPKTPSWPSEYATPGADRTYANVYGSYSGYNCPASGTLRYPTAYGGKNNSNVNIGYTVNDLHLSQQQRVQNSNRVTNNQQAINRVVTNYNCVPSVASGVLSPVKSLPCQSTAQQPVAHTPYISLYPQYSRVWSNYNNSADDSWQVTSSSDDTPSSTSDCVSKIKVHITDMYSSIHVISNNRDQTKNASRHAQHYANKSNLIEIVPYKSR